MNEAIENPGDESIISSKRVARVAPERAFREQQQEDLRAYKRMLHDKKAAARDAARSEVKEQPWRPSISAMMTGTTARQVHCFDIPGTVPYERLLEPDCWKNVSVKMNSGDFLECRCEQRRYLAHLWSCRSASTAASRSARCSSGSSSHRRCQTRFCPMARSSAMSASPRLGRSSARTAR